MQCEIAQAKARLEKDVVDKKLAAEIAELEEKGSSRYFKYSAVSYKSKVENWLEKSVTVPGLSSHNDEGHTGGGHKNDRNIDVSANIELRPQKTAAAPRPQCDIKTLTDAVRDAVGDSSLKKQNQELLTRLATSKDLPIYSGDPLEWLHFKEAFMESTNLCNYSDTENMWRLRKSLRGDAKEAISSLLISATSPAEVMETLELRFGRPENIMRRITSQLNKLQPLPQNYHSEIVNFAIKIKNFVTATRAVQESDYLRSPDLVHIVVSKLPTALVTKWADYLHIVQDSTTPKLELLSTFLYEDAKKIATSGVSYIYNQSDYKKKPETPRTHHHNQAVLVCTDTNKSVINCKFCNKESHSLSECTKFKRAMRRDRWGFVRANKVCFKCLGTRHEDSSTCTADNCDIDGCGWPHHRLLHWSKPVPTAAARPPPGAVAASRDEDVQPSKEVVAHATTVRCAEVLVRVPEKSITPKVMLKIVPVTIHGPKASVHTHALLDDGATVTLIAAATAERAGLHGESYTMRARSAWDSGELVCQTEILKFEISNSSGEHFKLRARKLEQLNLPSQCTSNIDYEKYKSLCSNYKFCDCQIQPTLLIGQDNYDLIAPIVCVKDKSGGPYITQTSLGWCVHGTLSNVNNIPHPPTQPVSSHCYVTSEDCTVGQVRLGGSTSPRARPPPPPSSSHGADATSHLLPSHSDAQHSSAPSTAPGTCDDGDLHCLQQGSDTDLHEFIRRSFALDSIGIQCKPRQNADELRAITILNDTAEISNGQWTVGLPWKRDYDSMPDSYPAASRRLKLVERKMLANTEYELRYRSRVEHLFINNYARELTEAEAGAAAGRVWYLPHFVVDNPNKKKLRLVFDAAAKSHGFSLNDFLLQGPDLLNSLYGIMFRFRENPIGIIGDIKDMFLRIKIQNSDQHALRFLWKDKMYAMTSLIFGANCSPFIAQFINQNKNASRFEDQMPDAVNAIRHNQYMDDFIDSFTDKNLATKVIRDITYINKQGGFEMHNWLSNEPTVLRDVPKDTLSDKAIKFNVDHQPERTLGLLWFPHSDMLTFDLSLKRIPEDILQLKRKPTKREMLSIVMSIFDIHGFLGPFTIKGKILMRETWKVNIQWDEQLNDELNNLFRNWIGQLKEINSIRIPRWYFLNENSSTSETALELHLFCDASPSAYAAVAYWRKESSDGRVMLSFIASKCKVTPTKPVSVPRLELQGAVLACRLAESIKREHRLKPSATYYWTDSTTVLHWIGNQCRTYKSFIANRLGEIDEISKSCEWQYVPTDLNIADLGTKNTDYVLSSDSEWFTGPSFLCEPRSSWPCRPENKESISDDVLEKVHTVYENNTCYLPVPDPSRFSSWLRLLRTTATVLLFVEKCKRRSVNGIYEELMRKSEIMLLKHAQSQSFQVEINSIKQNKELKRDSRLRTLTPIIDEDNLLRVGGRIGAAKDVDIQVKYPIILDGRNHIARLIVTHYHKQAAHSCNEMVINELRQKYWIMKLRPTVRTVANQCLTCRIKKTSPSPPRLGDLPEGRLTHHQRPFTVCGIDLFGPMAVAIGRRRASRYGVLFTCLTVRAVHVEIVSSLTTDSLIMALRRMAARRGWPHTLYSDNGTNLRGANTELKTAYREVLANQETLVTEALNKGVNWKFIPPVSPHMGGAWERLIRSIKTALRVVLKERAPREETLATLLCEVENIVNSRPLAHVSVDPHDPETLTPNHFLIGSSSNLPQPGVFDNSDLYLRKQWRIAQFLADLFWSRWVKEVLPTMIPRSKWHREGVQLKTGDLVVVADPTSTRNCWPRGVVHAVYPGADKRVRVVDVRTKSGILKRPVTRVALLFGGECRVHDTRGEDVDDVINETAHPM